MCGVCPFGKPITPGKGGKKSFVRFFLFSQTESKITDFFRYPSGDTLCWINTASMPCWRMSWLGNWWIPRRYSLPQHAGVGPGKTGYHHWRGWHTAAHSPMNCLAQSKPVLGVNLGAHWLFWLPARWQSCRKSWPAWLRGGIPLSRATCCARIAPAHNWHQVAMNDVVLFGNSRLHPMDYTVYCDGAFVSRYAAMG